MPDTITLGDAAAGLTDSQLAALTADATALRDTSADTAPAAAGGDGGGE